MCVDLLLNTFGTNHWRGINCASQDFNEMGCSELKLVFHAEGKLHVSAVHAGRAADVCSSIGCYQNNTVTQAQPIS